MKILLSIFAAVILSVSVYAGNDNNKNKNDVKTAETSVQALQISGKIVDDKNKENLAGAAIYIDGQKGYSDLEGNFNFMSISPGKHKIRVELISYETSEQEINVPEKTKLNILLVQK